MELQAAGARVGWGGDGTALGALDQGTRLDDAIDRIERAYGSIFDQQERRAALSRGFSTLRGQLADSFPDPFECEERLDELEVAQQTLDWMSSEWGRVALGLNPSCAIDREQLRLLFIEPIAEAMRRARWGNQSEPQAVPRMDIRAIALHLVKRYAGDAGAGKRKADVAARLVSGFALDRAPFSSQKGKVALTRQVWSYGRDTKRLLLELVAALGEAAGQEVRVPSEVELCPGNRIEVCGDISMRCFKEKVVYTMASRTAEVIRAFISECRS